MLHTYAEEKRARVRHLRLRTVPPWAGVEAYLTVREILLLAQSRRGGTCYPANGGIFPGVGMQHEGMASLLPNWNEETETFGR